MKLHRARLIIDLANLELHLLVAEGGVIALRPASQPPISRDARVALIGALAQYGENSINSSPKGVVAMAAADARAVPGTHESSIIGGPRTDRFQGGTMMRKTKQGLTVCPRNHLDEILRKAVTSREEVEFFIDRLELDIIRNVVRLNRMKVG